MIDNLDKEERDILESFERGEWKSVPNLEERKADMKKYARATMRKDKRVYPLAAEDLALQFLLEHFSCPEDARFYRSKGDIEDLRDFLIGFFLRVS